MPTNRSVLLTSVRTSRIAGVIPFAQALDGSVVLRTFLGFSRRHAEQRAHIYQIAQATR